MLLGRPAQLAQSNITHGVHVFYVFVVAAAAARCEPLSRVRASPPRAASSLRLRGNKPHPDGPTNPAFRRQHARCCRRKPSKQESTTCRCVAQTSAAYARGQSTVDLARKTSALLTTSPLGASLAAAEPPTSRPSFREEPRHGASSSGFEAELCRRGLAAAVQAADTKRAARRRAGIKAGSSYPVEHGGAP